MAKIELCPMCGAIVFDDENGRLFIDHAVSFCGSFPFVGLHDEPRGIKCPCGWVSETRLRCKELVPLLREHLRYESGTDWMLEHLTVAKVLGAMKL